MLAFLCIVLSCVGRNLAIGRHARPLSPTKCVNLVIDVGIILKRKKTVRLIVTLVRRKKFMDLIEHKFLTTVYL